MAGVDLEVLNCTQGTGCPGVARNMCFVVAAAGIDRRAHTCFPGQKEGRLESLQNFPAVMEGLPHKLMGIAPPFLVNVLSTTLHCYYR